MENDIPSTREIRVRDSNSHYNQHRVRQLRCMGWINYENVSYTDFAVCLLLCKNSASRV